VEKLVIDNTLRAVIVIPPQFGQNLKAGRSAEVQTWIDGTFPFRALTTKGYVTAINAAINVENLSAHFSAMTGISQEKYAAVCNRSNWKHVTSTIRKSKASGRSRRN
jgi:ABC-2 type transport system permease protein/ribosome-dependent ATPase